MKLAMSVTPTKFGGTACLRFEAACLGTASRGGALVGSGWLLGKISLECRASSSLFVFLPIFNTLRRLYIHSY